MPMVGSLLVKIFTFSFLYIKNSSFPRATMNPGRLLKPIRCLLILFTIIRHRIEARNVPRLRKCKERMDLVAELEEGEEEGEEELHTVA